MYVAEQLFSIGVLLAFILTGIAMYFLPAIIAGVRKHQNTGAIVVINLLLGWTFLGWVACLIWSFVDPGDQRQKPKKRPMNRICPSCGKGNPVRMKKCIHCGSKITDPTASNQLANHNAG